MPDLSLIMLGAGSSSRFKSAVKKQWLRINHTPLWLYATRNIASQIKFKKIILTGAKEELEYMKLYAQEIVFVEGGATRQESLKNALAHVESEMVLVSDVARACIPKEMLARLLSVQDNADIIVPYLPVNDTVVYENKTINRDEVKLIQTPQLSRTNILKKSLQSAIDYTDDSSAIKAMNGSVAYVLGSLKAKKLTFSDDINIIQTLASPSNDIFVGNGFDVHEFENNKPMYLGGVKIREDFGFKAHSDGDVAIHALIDSILGAIGAGDIGELFPDSDQQYKDIDSKLLLQKVVLFVQSVGYELINCDVTIMAQKPKLKEYKQLMRKTLAEILSLDLVKVNIKATTTEKLGFVGREEGVAVNATATVKYHDWKSQNENFNSRK